MGIYKYCASKTQNHENPRGGRVFSDHYA